MLNDAGLTAMVRHHHERLDGTGYPGRLAGEEIPLGARIIAVADTFDALTAHRPYRAARPHKEALDILTGEAGGQLDPAVVRAFCGHYSGRRPLTFWTSLMTLPERALEQLSGGVGALATAAKVAGVAAVVGLAAAGTATLSAPAPRPVRQLAELTSVFGLRPEVAASGTARPLKRAGAGAQGRGEGGGGPRQRVSSGGHSQGATLTAAGGSSAEAKEQPGESAPGPGGDPIGGGGSETTGNRGGEAEAQDGGHTPTLVGALEQTTGGVKEVVRETVKEVGQTVGVLAKPVGAVTAPAVEGLGETVGAVKGGVADLPGVSEATGRLGGIAGGL